MTLSIKPNEQNRKAPESKSFNVELVKVSTPIVMTLIGGVIGLVVLFTGENDAGFSLASTTIAAAAGLAQTGKDQEQKKD